MAIDADPTVSPYLQRNFAPVHDELNVDDLAVTGTVPEALNGLFLRNGPNQQFAPIGRYHVFDGDGMVHGVHLGDGRAGGAGGARRRGPRGRAPGRTGAVRWPVGVRLPRPAPSSTRPGS